MARGRRTTEHEHDELAAVVAHVDRTSADIAAAALVSYGLSATVVIDPAAGHAKATVPRSAPVHGVLVHRAERALALDVLARARHHGPDEPVDDGIEGVFFDDDELREWSADHSRRSEAQKQRMRRQTLGCLYVAFAIIVGILVAGGVAALLAR